MQKRFSQSNLCSNKALIGPFNQLNRKNALLLDNGDLAHRWTDSAVEILCCENYEVFEHLLLAGVTNTGPPLRILRDS